jgi:DNA-binding LacI/PurR family transcriptional regulator
MRLAGIEETLSARGLSLRSEDTWFARDYSRDAGTAFAVELCKRPKTQWPTGVILGNDPMALAFVRHLLATGSSVPADISVVGFDGTPDGEQCWPGLTTVRQPTRKMAARGCEVLLRSIAGSGEIEATSTEFPVELVVRESSAPPSR